ncbi:MAG: AMP-binding protein [Deltaproteobacteria bacterium]|uniref:AMP-binding protein n=1 Tax=Candidatus Zymogenus saltonus TaxID=2844893 RepID=A0A9D8KFI0_9DELT|nr:AMP-binding protein [Candidatus Zymogenus saltonus]
MKATGTLQVGNIIKVAAARYAGKEAIFCSMTGRRFTFHEMNERTNALANGLLSLGLKKGDVCAFLLYNRAEIVETYFALAKIGVMGIPLNYRLAPNEMVELMTFCDAENLIFDPGFTEVVDGMRGDLKDIKRYIGVGDEVPGFAESYDGLVKESSVEEPDVEVFEEDIQYMNLTSGTTGLPKAYLLTQYNNVAAGPFMAMAHDLCENDVILTVFPIFGRVGFAWCAMAFMVGARNVIHQFGQGNLLKLIGDEKVTISNWVPTIANIVMSFPDFDNYDYSSLRGLVFAAAPFPRSLQEKVKEKICPNIYEYYGLQESGILTQIKPNDKERKPDSVGLPHLGSDVRVVDTKGKDVPVGEVGEIIGRGAAVTTGYFKNEEKSKEMFKDGWFYTGDLGRFDEEGFLYLSGRKKDMIISGGQNVFAVEVEDILMSHDAIMDCAVIGLPDEKWGELVTAVVLKNPDIEVTEDEIIEYVRGKTAHFKAPKRVIFADSIPRTPTGKVTKFVLVEKYSK